MRMQAEPLDRFILASVLLHSGLFAFVLFGSRLFPAFGPNWGSSTASNAAGINVKIVGSASGIALPAPEVVSETAAANDSPGLYKSPEPAPPPKPTEKAEPIPEKTAPVKPAAPKPTPAPPAPKSAPVPETPSNAVPYGQGGRPNLAYGQFSTGAGEAGIQFGDSSFGDRFGTYVDALRRTISSNWLKSMVDSHIQRAPRVYLSFTIGRDGRLIGNVDVQQSSGVPTLDRSAQRAVLASTFPPLPGEYRGGDVHVTFYFEYSR